MTLVQNRGLIQISEQSRAGQLAIFAFLIVLCLAAFFAHTGTLLSAPNSAYDLLFLVIIGSLAVILFSKKAVLIDPKAQTITYEHRILGRGARDQLLLSAVKQVSLDSTTYHGRLAITEYALHFIGVHEKEQFAIEGELNVKNALHTFETLKEVLPEATFYVDDLVAHWQSTYKPALPVFLETNVFVSPSTSRKTVLIARLKNQIERGNLIWILPFIVGGALLISGVFFAALVSTR